MLRGSVSIELKGLIGLLKARQGKEEFPRRKSICKSRED
jgi:hypothetical protein